MASFMDSQIKLGQIIQVVIHMDLNVQQQLQMD